VDIRTAMDDDYDEMFTAFSRVVTAGEGFPQSPPLSREDFDSYWIQQSSVVSVAKFGGYLVGAYYIRPNFVGRAAHIANAGYFVLEAYRGTGVGRALVEHSLREAKRLGFDAMMFNLVFESNLARALYRRLGFEEIGRIPRALPEEDAFIYWRSLADVQGVEEVPSLGSLQHFEGLESRQDVQGGQNVEGVEGVGDVEGVGT
jgi:ribosomal protein S18 acetylase RimI-like enzyme